MICGSERFYKECLARDCPKCGSKIEGPCTEYDWIPYHIHMGRAPLGPPKIGEFPKFTLPTTRLQWSALGKRKRHLH